MEQFIKEEVATEGLATTEGEELEAEHFEHHEEVEAETQAEQGEDLIKRKKGRPRKENLVEPSILEEKKKRGRKKKEITAEDVKQKKKRGRKAAVKYFSSSIRKKIPLTTILQDSNNFILHLDIKDEEEKEMENSEITYDGGIASDNIFEQIKNENMSIATELQKEYNLLVENGDNMFTNDLNEDNEEHEDTEQNISDLYEKRLRFREREDSILINELKKETCENQNLNGDTNSTIKTENDIQSNRKKGFFEVMHNFVHNKTWLQNTDVCCWWCCHEFESVPIGLPMDYNTTLQKFRVKGVFCSFSCMIAYKNERHLYSKDHLVKFLYNKLTGTMLKDTVTLTPAPPRCSLKMFGGELSITEFRNCFQENKCYKMIDYPMYISKDYIEEVDIQNVKNVNQKVFQETFAHNLDDKRIEDAKSRLSQIEKTTVTLGNTIDQFIKWERG